MEGLQAATSVIALAELARRTALLIRRVSNAHRDAEGLCQKTQHLSLLLQKVGDILKEREQCKDDSAHNTQGVSIEKVIGASLGLCRECLSDMESRFKPLVDRDSSLTGQQFRQRLKYVRNHSYIAARERDIDIQLNYLSVALACLSRDEQTEQRAQLVEERQNREQASRQQLEMQQAFLRQLFSLFQFVFQAATRASSTGDDQQSAEFLQRFTEQLGNLNLSSIGNEETQVSLEDIFATSSSQGNLQRRYEDYVFNSSRVVEEPSEDENVGMEEVDLDILPEQTAQQELSDLEEPLVTSLTQYTDQTTLLLAIKQGNSSLVRNLLSDSTQTVTTDSHKWTILHHAVFCLHEDVVDVLLEHEQCASSEILNGQTKTGETALIFAAQRVDRAPDGQPRGYNIAQKLLQQPNCNVNIDDGVGSALYYAIKEGKPSSNPRRKLIRSMAAKGADVKAVREQIPESVEVYDDILGAQQNEAAESGRGSSANHASHEITQTNTATSAEQDTGEKSSRPHSRLSRLLSLSKAGDGS